MFQGSLSPNPECVFLIFVSLLGHLSLSPPGSFSKSQRTNNNNRPKRQPPPQTDPNQKWGRVRGGQAASPKRTPMDSLSRKPTRQHVGATAETRLHDVEVAGGEIGALARTDRSQPWTASSPTISKATTTRPKPATNEFSSFALLVGLIVCSFLYVCFLLPCPLLILFLVCAS